MLIVLLAFLTVLMLLEQPQLLMPAAGGPWALGGAIAIYLLVSAAGAGINSLLSRRALNRRGELVWPAVTRRHRAWSAAVQVWLIGGLGGLILLGLGRWALENRFVGPLPLAPQLVALSPFAAALVLVWVGDYPFHRAFRLRVVQNLAESAGVGVWSMREYLDYNLRHNLLFIAVPVSLIVAATDALRLYVHPLLPARLADPVVLIGTLLVAGAVFLVSPLLIVRIWRTSPLPPGRLREQLENTCRRLKLRCRDILVWRSGNTVANAGMMGLVGPLRYVLLTDALLANLDARGVAAIFAHEAGHILHRHIPYAAIFAVAVMGLSGAAADVLVAQAGFSPWWAQGVMLALLVSAWAWGFGRLSRMFERQSDVTAAALAGEEPGESWNDQPITQLGAATFAMALQRVAQLNGTGPYQRNWRHGSIAHRVGYVLWLAGAGGSPAALARTVRRVKVGLLLALSAAISLIAWNLAQ